MIADRMSDLYNGAVRARGNRDAMLMELRTLAKKRRITWPRRWNYFVKIANQVS